MTGKGQIILDINRTCDYKPGQTHFSKKMKDLTSMREYYLYTYFGRSVRVPL